jgi:hypothetical protein
VPVHSDQQSGGVAAAEGGDGRGAEHGRLRPAQDPEPAVPREGRGAQRGAHPAQADRSQNAAGKELSVKDESYYAFGRFPW